MIKWRISGYLTLSLVVETTAFKEPVVLLQPVSLDTCMICYELLGNSMLKHFKNHVRCQCTALREHAYSSASSGHCSTNGLLLKQTVRGLVAYQVKSTQ